jgi:hypothetical protein
MQVGWIFAGVSSFMLYIGYMMPGWLKTAISKGKGV